MQASSGQPGHGTGTRAPPSLQGRGRGRGLISCCASDPEPHSLVTVLQVRRILGIYCFCISETTLCLWLGVQYP